jgi:hypothetical protein
MRWTQVHYTFVGFDAEGDEQRDHVRTAVAA